MSISLPPLPSVLDRLDQYYRVQDQANNGAFNEWGVEVRRRVRDLWYFFDKIRALESQSENLWKSWPSEAIKNQDEQLILTEAFYWSASRCRSVIRQMPGLEKFECEGVRNARNKLLEHPEGSDSRILINSFGTGGPNGPVLKALRYEGEGAWRDRGLWPNAEEFVGNLIKILEVVLSNPALAKSTQSFPASTIRTIQP